jgi:heme/copper-type cytochrome/quinol oxidase subunit 1
MPRLSSWFIFASLIYLAGGFTLGAILLVNKGLALNPSIWNLLPIHSEVLLMGWFIQLAVGVAFWILPRTSGAQPRGNMTLAQLAFWLINFGILLVILSVITRYQALLLLGRLIELGGVLVFVSISWKRIRAFGSRGMA